MTGTSDASASAATSSSEPERITIAARKRDITRPVSAADSPRVSCSSSPRSTTGWPPSSNTPTSNEIRVRVEGRSKISPTERPASASPPTPSARPRFSSSARSRSDEQTGAIELLSGQEVGSHGSRRSYVPVRIPLHGAHRPLLEHLPRPRRAARPLALHAARRVDPPHRDERDPRPGQPRPLARVHRHALRRGLGRRPAAGVPAALAARLRARVRGRRPTSRSPRATGSRGSAGRSPAAGPT